LEGAVGELDRLIRRFRRGTGTRTDIILAGDFNRHDQLWEGDNISPSRQGEGDHSPDHRAIETAFDITIEDRPSETRLLFKNAPWAEIRDRVTATLTRTP